MKKISCSLFFMFCFSTQAALNSLTNDSNEIDIPESVQQNNLNFESILGQGYNTISNQRIDGTESCLTNPQTSIKTIHKRSQGEITIEIVDDSNYSEVINQNKFLFNIDGNYKNINASNKLSHFYEHESDEWSDSKTVIINLVHVANEISLKNKRQLSYDSRQLYIDSLRNDEFQEFRNSCGDNYVSSILTGRVLRLMVHISKKGHSEKETQTVANELKIALSQKGSADIKNDFSSFMQKHETHFNFKLSTIYKGITPSTITLRNIPTAIERFMNASEDDITVLAVKSHPYLIRGRLASNLRKLKKEQLDNIADAKKTLSTWERLLRNNYLEKCTVGLKFDHELKTLCSDTIDQFKHMQKTCDDVATFSECLPPQDNQCLLASNKPCNSLEYHDFYVLNPADIRHYHEYIPVNSNFIALEIDNQFVPIQTLRNAKYVGNWKKGTNIYLPYIDKKNYATLHWRYIEKAQKVRGK